MDYPKYLEKEKKDNQSHQSLVVLIDNRKDSINKRFGLQLTSGRRQKGTHWTEIQTIINIQIFTSLRLLRKAKSAISRDE